MALSCGAAALIFFADRTAPVDTGVIRTAFVLLSILTVPHFILEQMIGNAAHNHAARPKTALRAPSLQQP